MNRRSDHHYEFGPFRLDIAERLLLRDGESVPLTPKAFDLLLALAEHHGHLMEKDELLKLVWPDTFVEEANLSKTDGSPAVRLGEGANPMLSPDGEWVVAIRRIRPFFRVVLLPTGVGDAKTLTGEPIRCHYADWFPDGKRILIVGIEPGHGTRNYTRDLAGGKPRPITPEGIAGRWVSPNGQWIITRPISPDGQWLRTGPPEQQLSLFPVAGGEVRPIPGLAAGDEPIRWSGDGRSIYMRQREKETAQVRVYRLELVTGRRELWKEYVPDPSQSAAVIPLALTPDGKSYVYTYTHYFSDLYLVKGLK